MNRFDGDSRSTQLTNFESRSATDEDYSFVPCVLLQAALAQTLTANPSLTAPGGITFATNAANQVTEDPTFLWTPAAHRWDVPVGFNIFLGGERFFSMYRINGTHPQRRSQALTAPLLA